MGYDPPSESETTSWKADTTITDPSPISHQNIREWASFVTALFWLRHIQIQDQSEKLALRLEEIPLEIQHTRNWQILKTKVNGIRLDNLLRLRYEAFILSIETIVRHRHRKSYINTSNGGYRRATHWHTPFSPRSSACTELEEIKYRPTLASHHFHLL